MLEKNKENINTNSILSRFSIVTKEYYKVAIIVNDFFKHKNIKNLFNEFFKVYGPKDLKYSN